MPQPKDQKRRKAIYLKNDAISAHHASIQRLEHLIKMSNDNPDENRLLRAYDYDVNEGRRELIATFRQKIAAHDRDIVNTRANMGM